MSRGRYFAVACGLVSLATGCAWSVGGNEPSPVEKPAAAAEAAAVEAPAPTELTTSPAPPTSRSVEDRFSVQVSSIVNERAARDAAQGLADRGFPAYVRTAPASGKTYFQVRVGPFGDRDSADAIAATLQSLGYSTWIVAE